MDRHFIDQLGSTGILINDEEYEADINTDGALQFRFEGNVATHGFPVAIEGKTQQLTVAIDN